MVEPKSSPFCSKFTRMVVVYLMGTLKLETKSLKTSCDRFESIELKDYLILMIDNDMIMI